MLRSDTTLHLIHVWRTLLVCLVEKPSFATSHFWLDPPSGGGSVTGGVQEYKWLVLLCFPGGGVCVQAERWSVCEPSLFCAPAVQSCRGKQQNNDKFPQATKDVFFKNLRRKSYGLTLQMWNVRKNWFKHECWELSLMKQRQRMEEVEWQTPKLVPGIFCRLWSHFISMSNVKVYCLLG